MLLVYYKSVDFLFLNFFFHLLFFPINFHICHFQICHDLCPCILISFSNKDQVSRFPCLPIITVYFIQNAVGVRSEYTFMYTNTYYGVKVSDVQVMHMFTLIRQVQCIFAFRKVPSLSLRSKNWCFVWLARTLVLYQMLFSPILKSNHMYTFYGLYLFKLVRRSIFTYAYIYIYTHTYGNG